MRAIMAHCLLTGNDGWFHCPKPAAVCVSLLALPSRQNSTKTGGDTITVHSSFNAVSMNNTLLRNSVCHCNAMAMQILMIHHRYQTFDCLQIIISSCHF